MPTNIEDEIGEISLGMGQVAVMKSPGCLKAILGSCVAVALYHPRTHTGAMAHIVLPHSSVELGPPGKYADTAIPHMLKLLNGSGHNPAGLTAKVVGGANMFGSNGKILIGDKNVLSAIDILTAQAINVVGKDVGGTSGRRVTFSLETGEVTVETAGREAVVL